jgi:hypothetical protein
MSSRTRGTDDERRKTANDSTQESEDLVAADAVGIAVLVRLAEISAIGFAVAET